MKKLSLILIVLCFSLLLVQHAHGMSSTNYIMTRDVLSGGGGDMTSASYANSSTLGQSSAIGLSSSATYANNAGFWPAAIAQAQYQLAVTKAGTGTGTITVDLGALAWIGSVGTASYNDSTAVALSVTPDPGTTFIGWSGDADCSDGQVTMAGNMNCTATFTLNTYTISSFVSAGSGTVACTPSTVNYNGTSVCTIAPSVGYVVASVLLDQSTGMGAVPSYTFTNVQANHTISAFFAPAVVVYNVIASAGPGGSITPSGTLSVNAGSNANFTITAAPGHQVQSVIVDGSNKGAITGFTFSNVAANHTIAASFTVAQGPWNFTGNLEVARRDHKTTLLTDGRVLVLGWTTNSAELYDPATGAFSATGEMLVSHGQGATATRLSDGRVLVVGGDAPNVAEIYDPDSGIFSAISYTATPRSLHTATLLRDGRVLIVGGKDASGNSSAIAELFDPASGLFSLTGSLNVDRMNADAALLRDGRVLVSGGSQSTSPGVWQCLSSAELYNPASGTFSITGSMSESRCLDAGDAPVLPNGKVLIAGGGSNAGTVLASAELFDPVSGTFSATGSMAMPRGSSTVTLLPGGLVLVAGGFTAGGPVTTSSAELYDPATGTFKAAASMATARQEHTATLLPIGKVLVTGGYNPTDGNLSSSELYALPLVYDNMLTDKSAWQPIYQPGLSVEAGDEITLAGTDRHVTSIDILVFQSHSVFAGKPYSGTVDARVRFYKNDGPNRAPGSLLWDSGVVQNVPYGERDNTFSFAVPSVLVPDTFVWTIELSNVKPANPADPYNFGLLLYDPPYTGSSGSFVWQKYTTWVQFSPSPYVYDYNYAARVSASYTVTAPSARFTWKTDAHTDYKVLYDASATVCPTGATCTFSWSSGESVTDPTRTTSHQFPDGTKTSVMLTVTSSTGGSDSTALAVTPKYVGSNPTQVSNLVVTPTGYAVTANYSLSGGIAPYTVKATWGDGKSEMATGVAAGANSMSHTYANAGTYTVTITATDTGVNNVVTTNSKNASVTIVASTLKVSGKVTRVGGVTAVSSASVTLKLNGVAKKLVYTNATGDFSMTGVAPGTYTVTVAKSGLTFANPAATITVTATDVTGVNISSTN